MMKFRVGEIAIMINTSHSEYEGKECRIDKLASFLYSNLYPEGKVQYVVTAQCSGKSHASEECNLKKIPPKQEVDKWENCVWEPNDIKIEATA